MLSKILLIALAASPLVSAHGKIAVIVNIRIHKFKCLS